MSDLLKGAYLNRSGETIGSDKAHIDCHGCEGATNESVAAELFKAIEFYNSMQDSLTWRPIESAPIDKWCLFLDGDKTMGHHEPHHHIDKVDKRGQALVNYTHNYTHWMPLPPMPEVK